jgi:dolichol-phosphate mannosyltransferase
MDGRQPSEAATARSLSLIIPAYNEGAGIEQAVDEAEAALRHLSPNYEILVVDDGSSDDTARIVRRMASGNSRIRLMQHESNRGYGAALRTGFEAAYGELVAFTDADCQFYLEDLARLLPLADHSAVAVGYRVARQDRWLRRFLSWGYNRLVHLLLGTSVRDCDCALKVFRHDALTNLLPETDRFFVNTEMLARARQQGYEIAEAGVRHRPRARGRSKVSLYDIPRTLQALLPFWWSRILFPGRDGEPGPATESAAWLAGNQVSSAQSAFWANLRSLDLPVLVLAALLLFFARLGCPLQEPEEPRYAEIPRQMLEAGQFLVPTLHGLPYYDKPPLLYWLVMGSYRLFGVHDWAARLVSGTAAFLTVLVTYFWGRRLAGRGAGFAAAMILCLSVRYVYLGRLLTMNGPLCLWTTAALATSHFALRGPGLQRGWWLASAALAALGLLTKGPVALVLVLPPILGLQVLDPRLARLRLRDWLGFLGLVVSIACPWYLGMALRESEFAGHFFWRHNVVRYLVPFDHAKPVWFYLPDVWLGMLPWSLLLMPLLILLARRRLASDQRRPAALGFFLLPSVWCFMFFSLAGSKRSGYILPAMPPLALALGTYLDGALRQANYRLGLEMQLRWSQLGWRLASLVLVSGAGMAMLAAATGIMRLAFAMGLASAGLVSLAILRTTARNRSPEFSWMICGAVTFVVLLAGLQWTLPGYARRFSLRGQTRPLAELARSQQLRVISYPRAWDSVSFYLRRDDIRVYGPAERGQLLADLRSHGQTLAFIKCDSSQDRLLENLPGSIEFLPAGRQGYVQVGWLRPRAEIPSTLLAGH